MTEEHPVSCRCRSCDLQVMIAAQKRISSFVGISLLRQGAAWLLLKKALDGSASWDVNYEVQISRQILAGSFPGGPDASG